MKSYLLNLILFTLISSCTSAQKNEPLKKVEHYENGQKKAEYTYVNAVLNGPCMFWNKKGEVAMKGFYKNGTKDSLWINYEVTYEGNNKDSITERYKDGQLIRRVKLEATAKYGKKISEEITEYRGGVKYDTLIAWYPDLGIMESTSYAINDEVEGLDRGWYENGQLRYEINRKNAYKTGRYMEWDEKGNVTREEYYEKGKLIKKVK